MASQFDQVNELELPVWNHDLETDKVQKGDGVTADYTIVAWLGLLVVVAVLIAARH
ncbi:hypothetical protein KW785_03725 [Candidatus Parcubacteria bacterium]|nr:hypothetical protein [Candidatus Parcubacteria bacterium]